VGEQLICLVMKTPWTEKTGPHTHNYFPHPGPPNLPCFVVSVSYPMAMDQSTIACLQPAHLPPTAPRMANKDRRRDSFDMHPSQSEFFACSRNLLVYDHSRNCAVALCEAIALTLVLCLCRVNCKVSLRMSTYSTAIEDWLDL
jgi:hypothetical protein